MIPAAFEYLRPETLAVALDCLDRHGEDAKLLAGGHSLIPSMKLRLAQPEVVVDLGRITRLTSFKEKRGKIIIGAMVTHREIELSQMLAVKCPLLPEVAKQIGDVQVRNRGTIGGSLVHADPAGDWPAAILALEAEMVVANRKGERRIPAHDFFVDLFQTAVQPDEILVEIRVSTTSKAVAYVKSAQKASGFAIAGVAAIADLRKRSVRVGVTGVGAIPYRASATERKLKGKKLSSETISIAAESVAEGIEALNDIHASDEYRRHLALVNTSRVLKLAASRG